MSTHRKPIALTLLALTLLHGPSALLAQDDCPPALTFYSFNHETLAEVTATAGINLRAEPSTSGAIVGDIPDGVDIRIDEDTAPVCADGYRWRPVRYAGLEGWVAEGRGGDAGYNLKPVVMRFGTQGRVSYQVDERLSSRTDFEVVPPDAASGEPGYETIHFTNYRYAGVEFVDPPYYLRLYRVADLPEGSVYTEAIAQIRDILHARVEQLTYTATLPLLPPLAGVDAAYTQTSPLDFDGGAGVRDVVAYLPPTGAEPALAYRFMGLTYDGEYFLSLTLPIDPEQFDALTPQAIVTQFDARVQDRITPRLGLMDGLARSLRVNRAEAVTTTDPNAATTTASFGGIRFAYPSELAYRVEFDMIAPNGDIVQMMPGPQPGRTVASFVGYPVTNPTRQPQITVIDAGRTPADVTQVHTAVDRLQQLVEAAPVLQTAESPQDDATAQALLGTGEHLFLQPEWVTFEGGRGIRYLTMFSQNYVNNVDPDKLYYVYEGLSDDGELLVYAQFPLTGSYTLTTPPNDSSDISGGPDGMSAREAAYIAEVSRELDRIAGDAFTPTLATLDGIVESLVVSR